MDSNISVGKLKFVTLPGAHPEPQYAPYYHEAYRCWHEVWSEAYAELDVDKKIYSDDFVRQTEVSCIFHDRECVGMLFLTWADFSQSQYRHDSYFKIWNEEDLAKLTAHGPKVLICSNTTVAKKWRRGALNFSMKDLLLYFICERFRHSGADAMTGVLRRARGIHDLCQRFGAVELRCQIPHFNENDLVDLAAFYKHTIKLGTDPIVAQLGSRLWNEKIVVKRTIFDLPQIIPEINADELKKAA